MRSIANHALVRQLTKFALVGGVGFVVDSGTYALLRLSPAFEHAPLKAKVISTILAIIANWIGNRYWVFGPHRSTRNAMEAIEFGIVSLLGMGVALACLYVSHYLLGLDTLLADFISGQIVGLILGSAIRFLLYRHWVYHPRRRNRVRPDAATPGTPEPVAR